VGSALASPDPFAVRVLSCFMRRFAFSGLRIDEVRMRAQNGGDLVGCHLAYGHLALPRLSPRTS